jgi:PAS domain S-box-containing protein
MSFLLLLLVVQASAAPVAPSGSTKNVLILLSFSDNSVPGSLESLESSLRSRVSFPINYYVEYLEARRFEGDARYEKNLVDNLHQTYSTQKLDLVIGAALPALQFAIRHREELFPNVSIVFMEVDSGRIAGHKLPPGVTGVTTTVDIPGTIDLALRLHPKTDTVAIVTNISQFENYWLGAVHAELLHRPELKEIDLVGLAPEELLKKVAALPPHSIVLFQELPQESEHLAIRAFDALRIIGQRVPTYCIFSIFCLDHGGIGGSQTSENEEIQLASQVAARVLSGEPPENIPIVNGRAKDVRVDWRQLRRWNISESALPPDTVVLYRELTLWERDRNYILGAALLIVVQSVLIVGLLMQRARKRKAEAVLRESEKRFRVMADTTPSLIWMCDQAGKITYLNDRRQVFTGGDPSAGYSDTWTAYVHPGDLPTVLDTVSRALKTHEPFSKEYRLRRSDGIYRWMFDVAAPRVNGDGSFAGFIGSAIDVTDQKLAQEALESVSGRLIEAQEKERSRIARDLHDDICQRLALLSMELEQANRNGAPPSTKRKLEEIRQHCSEITGDVQSLSHQLHSSKLEYLGIVAAIRAFCKEFAKQHDVSIDFRDENVPTHLPRDISLCLFRVAQEALHNAVKYSGTSRFSVDVRGVAGEVQLVVNDVGAGFDVEEAKRNRGLGLVSMQERVHLVHGRFDVESRPGGGTRILAVVPVVAVTGDSSVDGESNQAASVTGAT